MFFFLLLAVATYALLLPAGCARIGHPTGGEKDTIPPVLLKTQPQQGALFFKKKKVVLTFNEHVRLKDADKQFIMSPPPEKRPSFSPAINKKIVVKFNSPLRDSTTYQLNFGESIVDNNEGNPYGVYRLAFSTGAVFDSLRVAGLALDAYSDQPLSTPLIYLYEDLSDSVVLKIRPDNITRPNEDGEFLAENLKSKPYKIVAIDDVNRNYKYDAGQEAIGFLDMLVEPVAMLSERHHDEEGEEHEEDEEEHEHHEHHRETKLVLRMFTEDVKPQYIISCEQVEKRALKMTFNAPFPQIDSLHVDSMDAQSFVVEASPRQDTLLFWFADTAARVPDTLHLSFVYFKTDTLGGLSPSPEKRRLIFEEKKREEKSSKSSKSSGIGGLISRLTGSEEETDTTPKKPAHWTLSPRLKTSGVSPIQPLSMDFSPLLISVNPKQIKIEERRINPRSKDTSYVEVKYELVRDSVRLRQYRFMADWKENSYYRYTMLLDAFWDVYSQTNDTIQGSFTTVDPDKMARLLVDFTGVDGSYIVQLTDAKGKAILREAHLNANAKLEFKYVNQGSYGIRIVKDENANGKWDTGSYFKHVQPEYATFLKASDGKLEFAFKQGWDVELSVDMKTLFPEM